MRKFVLSGVALVLARRLHLGYVAALEGSIHRHAGDLPDPTEDDAGAWLQTVGGFDLSGIRSRLVVATGSPPVIPEPVHRPPATEPSSQTTLSLAIMTPVYHQDHKLKTANFQRMLGVS